MLEKKIKLDIAYLVSITHNNIVFLGCVHPDTQTGIKHIRQRDD